MKILIAINDFLIGGAQKLIVDQVKVWGSDTFDEIQIVTFFDFPDKENVYTTLPAYIKVTKLGFKGFFDIAGWKRLRKFLSEYRPDTVISHLFLSNAIIRLFKLVYRYKVITVEHNTYIYNKTRYILVDRLLARMSDMIIAVSETVKNFVAKQQKVHINKITVIQNGVDLDPIKKFQESHEKAEEKKILNLKEDALVFLNVGRLTAQKNQELLIQGFAKYAKTCPKAVLLIVGEGALRDSLQKLINNLEIGDQVKLLGAKQDVYRYFIVADYFISSSHIEGLSIAYIEALAFGVPLIATKTAGTDEMLHAGENGVFIDDKTDEGICKAINEAVTMEYASLSAKARISAEKYDIHTNAKAYEQLINTINAL